MRKILFLMFVFALWSFNLTTAQEPITAEVVPDRLNIRATPNGEIIGQLIRGTQVEVLGREDDLRNDKMWVYVREIQSGLMGWVARFALQYPSDFGWYDFELTIPILLWDERTLSQPVPAQGVIIGHRYCYGYPQNPRPVNVRFEPNYDAQLTDTLPCHSLVAVYGRYEEWVYFKQIGGDIAGWTHGPNLEFPMFFNYYSLPTLDPVPNPSLDVPLLEPADTLTARPNRNAPMRFEPSTRYEIIHIVQADIAITLVGRNANSLYFKTTVDGYTGWISYQDIEIDGDPNRLPILSLKGSPNDRYR